MQDAELFFNMPSWQMPKLVSTRKTFALAVVILTTACNKGMPDGPGSNCPDGVCPYSNALPPSDGVAQFSFLPVTPGPGLSITALGNLNPPGHVLPTDHAYLYNGDLSGNTPFGTPVPRTVYQPATGTLFQVIQNSSTAERKLMFRATTSFFFYLDHVVPTLTMAVGDTIKAGTVIGTTLPGFTVDLGAFDASVTLTGFLTPSRYPYQSLHAVSPWKYFTPALQSQIYPHLYRAPSAPDRDGKIDFGVAGTLSGDWFLQGMPADSSAQPYGWTRTISFAYDYYDPSQVRISIGGTVGPAGVWAIDSAAPRPVAVTTASGVVAYRLYSQFDNHPQAGLLLVQMVSDSQIRVELFQPSTAGSGQFDQNVWTFVR